MASLGSKLLSIISPKKTGKTGGTSATPTYNPQQNQEILTVPRFDDHRVDIFNSRQSLDSRELMQFLFRHDPDCSAAVNAFLTMADTEMLVLAKDMEGEIDPEATKLAYQLIERLTRRFDHTLGFQLRPSLDELNENMRYYILLRGMICVEAIFDKALSPYELRLPDPSSIEWREKKAGEYKPEQRVEGQNDNVSLDIPSFFTATFRRDPSDIYTFSSFVASINTISARQSVINDLYRIMRVTGFPRMELKIVEEVLLKSVPANLKNDQEKTRQWMNDRLVELQNLFTNIRSDQAVTHFDSVEIGVLNSEMPGMAMDITSVIDTLNNSNQAALKTMSTIIGRGDSGVNTASVESRIAAMNADQLNNPVASIWSQVLSFLLQLNGFQGFATVWFRPAELRPVLELEPQLTMKQNRLLTDLSYGLISDDEYHLEMYGRLRPDFAPELSGTNFMQPPEPTDPGQPGGDTSLNRSLSPKGSKSAKSKTVKTKK